MHNEMKKAALTHSRKHLVETMQMLGFGRIEGLVIRKGEPSFDPHPRVVREIRFGAENGPRRELSLENFVLKKEVLDLLKNLRGLDDGTAVSIEVKHGLPFKMEVEHSVKL